MSAGREGSADRDLLLRLAAGDEASLRAILRASSEPGNGPHALDGASLDRRTRLLVRLGALLAVGASTESLRWAVDLAATAGASS